MKYQVYVKKEINTEDDLPKEEGRYIVKYKDDIDHVDIAIYKFGTSYLYGSGYWLIRIDWYLQPIELDLPDDEEIEKQARITHNDNTYRWIYTLAIHWLKNKIENQLK